MYKIGIIGPESTGKSVLAENLAERLNGLLIPEYARYYVEHKGTTDVTWDELCEIAKYQIDEIASIFSRTHIGLKSNSTTCIFDTELIVTKVWYEYVFGQVPEWLNEAIKTYPMDVYLLCMPDIPWIPDKARSNGGDAIRWELYRRYEEEIQNMAIPYYIIRHEQ
ncbi:MAG: ATP-binding protein [Paludibacteraceae bacterium]|nr:ATP-binding protein [Paludibacteraceae bacterium]